MERQSIKAIEQIAVELVEPPIFSLEPHEKALIEEIWQEEKRLRGDTLYDGKIFHVLEQKGEVIQGCMIPYRLYLAVQRVPELRSKISLCTLAVSAMTWKKEEILIGQRSSHVTQYPLFWELAPAGGVGETTDLAKELLREMEEELGITPYAILHMKPGWLVYDTVDAVLEVVFHIELKECHVHQNKEYEKLEWVTLSVLKDLLTTRHFVPFTAELVHGC